MVQNFPVTAHIKSNMIVCVNEEKGTATHFGTGPITDADLTCFSLSNRYNRRAVTKKQEGDEDGIPLFMLFNFKGLIDYNTWVRSGLAHVWNEMQAGHGYSKIFGCPDKRWAVVPQSIFCNKRFAVFESLAYNLVKKEGFTDLIVRTGCFMRDELPEKYLAKDFPTSKLGFLIDGHYHEIPVLFYFKFDLLDKIKKNRSFLFVESNFVSEDQLEEIDFDKIHSDGFCFSDQDVTKLWASALRSVADLSEIEKLLGKKLSIRDSITVSHNGFMGTKGNPRKIFVAAPEPGKCKYGKYGSRKRPR